jgi:hypothetical protein
MELEQEAVVGAEPTAQRLDQHGAGGLEATRGELDQALGIGLAGDQRLEQGPAALAHDVAGSRR